MKFVKKSWGNELWFENNEMYCGKLLVVRPGEWSSRGKFHYHKIKDETFFIVDGTLRLDIADDDGKVKKLILLENDSVRIKPEVRHRFTAQSTKVCKFVEVSTTHSDDDSYRCWWDDEKQTWVED